MYRIVGCCEVLGNGGKFALDSLDCGVFKLLTFQSTDSGCWPKEKKNYLALLRSVRSVKMWVLSAEV